MIRNMVKIDEDKCNGCGICINACHEGALQLIDGKAKLVSDIYCDGLGNCLSCPLGAISIEEREAEEFDEEAVNKMLAAKAVAESKPAPKQHMGCPGSRVISIEKKAAPVSNTSNSQPAESHLRQWPVQIKLVPAHAPYFDNANVLIAADCTAFAYANIHNEFMKNKITLIGCPKLDEGDYSEKLTQILMAHEIKSLTILRMEVPCCGGIVQAAKQALINSGKMVPWSVVTISTDGNIVEN